MLMDRSYCCIEGTLWGGGGGVRVKDRSRGEAFTMMYMVDGSGSGGDEKCKIPDSILKD